MCYPTDNELLCCCGLENPKVSVIGGDGSRRGRSPCVLSHQSPPHNNILGQVLIVGRLNPRIGGSTHSPADSHSDFPSDQKHVWLSMKIVPAATSSEIFPTVAQAPSPTTRWESPVQSCGFPSSALKCLDKYTQILRMTIQRRDSGAWCLWTISNFSVFLHKLYINFRRELESRVISISGMIIREIRVLTTYQSLMLTTGL